MVIPTLDLGSLPRLAPNQTAVVVYQFTTAHNEPPLSPIEKQTGTPEGTETAISHHLANGKQLGTSGVFLRMKCISPLSKRQAIPSHRRKLCAPMHSVPYHSPPDTAFVLSAQVSKYHEVRARMNATLPIVGCCVNVVAVL